jgi:hypothetical protein
MGNILGGCCCCEIVNVFIPKDYETILRRNEPTTDERIKELHRLCELLDDGWLRIKKEIPYPYSYVDLFLGLGSPIGARPPGDNVFGGVEFRFQTPDSNNIVDGDGDWVLHEGPSQVYRHKKPLRIRVGQKRFTAESDYSDIISGQQGFGFVFTPLGVGLSRSLLNPVENTVSPEIDLINDHIDRWFQIDLPYGTFFYSGLINTAFLWSYNEYHEQVFFPLVAASEKQTLELHIRPKELTLNIDPVLHLTAGRTQLRKPTDLDASPDEPTKYYRRQCPPVESCPHNGPSFATPRWHVNTIKTPIGNYQFPDAEISRQQIAMRRSTYDPVLDANQPDSRYASVEEANDHTDRVNRWSRRVSSPDRSYIGCETIIRDPVDRSGSLIREFRRISQPYIELQGEIPDTIDGESELNPEAYWDPPDTPPDKRFQWRPYQGGGTVDNAHPFTNTSVRIAVIAEFDDPDYVPPEPDPDEPDAELPPVPQVRTIRVTLSLGYDTKLQPGDEYFGPYLGYPGRRPVPHLGLRVFGGGGPVRMFGNRSSYVHPDMTTNRSYSVAYHYRFWGIGFDTRRIDRVSLALVYETDVPAWDGEPPEIDITAEMLTEVTLTQINTDEEQEATTTTTHTSGFATILDDFPLIESIRTIISGGYGRRIENQFASPDVTGRIEYQVTERPMDPTKFSFTAIPADDELGHPTPAVTE